jgi:aryl sulfotransferase
MKILQSGIPKSGNYWLYTINRQLLSRSNIEYTSFIENQPIYDIAKSWKLSLHNQAEVDVLDIMPGRIINRISRIYEMPVENFDRYIEQTTITWTHSKFHEECLNIYQEFDKIIFIARDPRAVALSAAKFQNKAYSKKHLGSPGEDSDKYLDKNLEMMIKSWALKMLAYLTISQVLDTHLVFYENLKKSPAAEIRRLSNYLEINIDDKQINQIVDAVSLESMKKDSPKHVRKGKLYEWKEKLSNIQKWKVDFIAGSILNNFGFPDRNGIYPQKLELKEEISKKRLKRMKKWIYISSLLTGGHKYINRKIESIRN